MAIDYGNPDDVKKLVQSQNLAEDNIEDETLIDIGKKVVEWFDEDEESRREWKERSEVAFKLATQVIEKKTYPWPNAANVKFPLLATAAMQFAARAYPTLVPGPRLVQGLVIGEDPQGEKGMSARRVGEHMSYQILWEMDDWDEDMDKLCLLLPIVGCAVKKTYYDDIKKINCSHLISPYDFVIDYYAKSLETASRKTHVIHRNKNEIQERIRKGLYCDVELGQPQGKDESKNQAENQISGTKAPADTPATPYKILEMHTYWDLDGDGYEEPYIFTVDYASQKVLRAVVRFEPEGIEQDEDGEITYIKPVEYFTKFEFIPNPDGAFYGLGFGLLLGGINETVNTLTNQLLDAGTLSNLQGGFLGRGIRMRSAQTGFQPGEWKPVDFTGDDIKKHIFQIPAKEPSEVLFKLVETLVVSGKELASVAEIFVGKMPGQNTPATTTMATIEQGLKILTAIIKRIYRSLQKEYQKLFRLNAIYMDDKTYFTVNGIQGQQGQEIYRKDYDLENISVKPFADPNIVSSSQRLMKVQAMMPLLEMQLINPKVFAQQYLEAIEAENIPQLMQVQPQPNPEMMKVAAQGQLKQQEFELKAKIMEMEAAQDQKDREQEARFKAIELQLKAKEQMIKAAGTQAQTQAKVEATRATTQAQVEATQVQHEQKLQHSEQQFQQKQQQAAAQPKPKGKSK